MHEAKIRASTPQRVGQKRFVAGRLMESLQAKLVYSISRVSSTTWIAHEHISTILTIIVTGAIIITIIISITDIIIIITIITIIVALFQKC